MIRRYCAFKLKEHLFGLEVSHVQEIVRHNDYTPVPLAPPGIAGLMNLRGQILMAVDLRGRLGMEPRDRSEESINLILRTGETPVSVLVDDVRDIVEAEEDRRRAPPPHLQGEIGACAEWVLQLEKQTMVILDPNKVLEV